MGATLSECAGLSNHRRAIEESERKINDSQGTAATDFIVKKKGKFKKLSLLIIFHLLY